MKNKIKISSDLFLLLVAFSLPLHKRLAVYIIILWVAFWLIEGNFRKKLKDLKDNKIFLLPVSFYILHLIGLLYTQDMGAGRALIVEKISFLAFPVVLFSSVQNTRERFNSLLKWFIAGNVLAALICIFVALYHFIIKENSSYFFYSEFSVFHHTSYFAMYVVFSMSALFFLVEKHEKFRNKIWFGILTLFFLVIVQMLNSRAGTIGFFLILFYIILLLQIDFWKKATGIILVGILFFVIYNSSVRFKYTFTAAKNISHIEHSKEGYTENPYYTQESTSVRLIIYRIAQELALENFIIGVGSGDVKDALMQKYELYNVEGALQSRLNAHNQFFETLIALGLPGLSLLLLLFVYPFIVWIKQKNHFGIQFLLIVFLNFLFETMLNTQAGIVFFPFFYCLLLIKFPKEKTALNIESAKI